MEEIQFKYVWMDENINSQRNQQQLQIFQFLGLEGIKGFSQLKKLNQLIKESNQNDKIIIISSSGMLKKLQKSKVFNKQRVFDRAIVFCGKKQKAKQCLQQFPKIVYSAQITDYATQTQVQNIKLQVKKDLGGHKCLVDIMQRNLRQKLISNLENQKYQKEKQINNKSKEFKRQQKKQQKNQQKKKKQEENKQEENKQEKQKKKQVKKQQTNNGQFNQMTKRQKKQENIFLNGNLIQGKIPTGQQSGQQQQQKRQEQEKKKQVLYGIYIGKDIQNMKQKLNKFNEKIKISFYETFNQGQEFILEQFQKCQRKYILFFTKSSFEKIFQSNFYPYQNVNQYVIYSNDQNQAYQIGKFVQKKGEDHIPIVCTIQQIYQQIEKYGTQTSR